MKKQNIRVRRNTVAKIPSPQAETQAETTKPMRSVAQPLSAPQKRALPKRVTVIYDELAIEPAVDRAIALLGLFSRMDCVLTERGFTWRGSQACGFQYWSWDLGGALHADFQAAHDASRNKGGDRIETTRRLGKTIQKVSTMLLMFAHDLGLDEDDYQGWAEYRGDLDYDLSSHLSLAADCIEYLELSFYDKFERHLELDRFNRECREDKLRKYRQAQEQRAAA